MAGISSKAAGGLINKKGYNGNEIQNKEFSDGSGLELYDFNARTYGQQIGRFIQIDPESEEADQESWSPYHFGYNNPINNSDPDGRTPITGLIGAIVGGVVGGGIEAVTQLVKHGEINNWRAVGGATVQGAITGGGAGLPGGASLLVTAGVSSGANVVGGAANRAIQGQGTTLTNVAKDATVGAVLGAGGKMVGHAVSNGTNNLSNSAKGKLGEAVTEIKYGAQGYKSAGNDVVKTGGKTATGRQAEARFDHKMTNVFTGKKITVESKFNTSGFTKNQSTVIKNGYKVIEDRTTSNGLGNAAKAATVGTVAGMDAQRNKRP
jgi:RHS repeat-associated protein